MKTFSLKEFLGGYIDAALWSSVDDDDDPIDQNYSPSDLADDALTEMEDACVAFINQNRDELKKSKLEPYKAGIDFWLSRNGHGAGFFDNGHDKLQEAARKFGESHVYVGDDGELYIE